MDNYCPLDTLKWLKKNVKQVDSSQIPVDKVMTKTAISRAEAAKLLNISTRTLDRYVRQQKITPVRHDRAISFPLNELRRFQQKESEKIQPKLNLNENILSEETEVIQGIRDIDKDTEHMEQNTHGHIYKKLYEDVKEELSKKQEIIQGANFRIGQLETKLQNMVPLLELKKQQEETDKITKSLSQKEQVCKILQKNFEVERYNKKIFTLLFFLSVSLFPILLLIHFLSI